MTERQHIQGAGFDIDGTLLRHSIYDDNRDMPPTPRVEGAMARLRAAGIPAFAVTSRNEELMQTEPVRRLRFTGLSAIDGGATIYNPLTKRIVDRNWLRPRQLRDVVGTIGSFCSEIYCGPGGKVRTAEDLAIDDIRQDAPSVFAVFAARHRSEIEERLEHMGLAFFVNAMNGSREVSCVQITDPAATKEQALLRISGELGIPLEHMLAMGDGPGDAGFIGRVGVRTVMGNADPVLFRVPRRIIIPSVDNDGAAIGIEHYVFGEPGELRRERPSTWRDGQRPPMSIKARDAVLANILEQHPLVHDAARLHAYVNDLYTVGSLDPWKSVTALKRCLTPEAQQLYTSDLDLLRPCSGEGHAAAVRSLLEEQYAPYIYHQPLALVVARLYADLQDSGKPLSVAITGDNFSQETYNALVIDNVARSLQGEHAADIGTGMRLLSKYDWMIGKLLRSKPEDYETTLQKLEAPLAELRAAWPEAIGVPADDLLLIAYLTDAGAHTRYAAQQDELAEGFGMKWAVTEADQQLTGIFEQTEGGLLLLQPEQRRRVNRFLTGAEATTALLQTIEDDLDADLGNHAAELRASIHYFFIRARMRHPERLEPSEDGQQVGTIRVEHAPEKWNWVKRLSVYETSKEQTPPSPQALPRPYIVAEGTWRGLACKEIYYVRGGRIWRKTEMRSTGERTEGIDRMWVLNGLYERELTRQHHGAEAVARGDIRHRFGEPLSSDQAEELMIWLGSNGL